MTSPPLPHATRRRALLASAAFVWLAAGVARPAKADDMAPDVVVFCDQTLYQAIEAAGRAWRDRSSVAVRIFTAPDALSIEQLRRDVRNDVLVTLGVGSMDQAGRAAVIKSETRVMLAHAPFVLAGRNSSTRPIVLTSADGLPASGQIAIIDPAIGRAGADAQTALAQIGVWPALGSRVLGAETSLAAAGYVVEGRTPYAFVYATDAAAAGLAVIATVNEGMAAPVEAALTSNLRSPRAAEFLAFLTNPDAHRALLAAGLIP